MSASKLFCLIAPRPGFLPVLAAFLLGLAVRGYHLDYKGLSFDESFSWGISRFAVADIVRRTAVDVHPPLYYLCLKGWVELFGAAALPPRVLSTVVSAVSIPLLYLVCLEAAEVFGVAKRRPRDVRLGALFSAFLLAVQSLQVDLGRTLRMYSLGVFLAGCTSWLLLRALRGTPWRSLWWSLHGLTTAAICYTHNYALFSVAGQALWALGYVAWRWRAQAAEARAGLLGLLQAGLIGGLLFSPWLPVLWTQARAVQQGYWIPDLNYQRVERMLFGWLSGADYTAIMEARCWLALAVGLIAWAVWRGGPAGWFFLVPALVPWLLSLGLSVVSGRSILVERYLAFAQFSLLGLWGVTWWCLPGLGSRLVLTGFLGGYMVSGFVGAVARFPERPFAMSPAVAFLRDHHQPGDIILMDDPCDSNHLHYFVARAGLDDVTVQCPHLPTGGGPLYFNTCMPALGNNDFFVPREPGNAAAPRRVWWGSFDGTPSPAAGFPKRIVLQRTFEGGAGSRYTLVLLEEQ